MIFPVENVPGIVEALGPVEPTIAEIAAAWCDGTVVDGQVVVRTEFWGPVIVPTGCCLVRDEHGRFGVSQFHYLREAPEADVFHPSALMETRTTHREVPVRDVDWSDEAEKVNAKIRAVRALDG